MVMGGFSLLQTPFGLFQRLLSSWTDAGTHLLPSNCPEEAGKMLFSLDLSHRNANLTRGLCAVAMARRT